MPSCLSNKILKTFTAISAVAFSMLTYAASDPASSVGRSSSTKVDIKALYERIMGFGDFFLNLLALLGIALGAVIILTGLYQIIQINAGQKQGSVGAWAFGIFIGLFMMSIITWSFYGSMLVINFIK